MTARLVRLFGTRAGHEHRQSGRRRPLNHGRSFSASPAVNWLDSQNIRGRQVWEQVWESLWERAGDVGPGRDT
jgi:hypothetical protein